MTSSTSSRLRRLFSAKVWGYGLFWSWNLIFLAFMALGFAPTVLPNLIDSVRVSQAPPEFLLYAVVLTLIPVAAVALALSVLRREPGKLLVLGYGVEGPLMLVLAMRFFVVRQATPAVTLMIALAALGMATLLWQLLDRRIDQRGPVASTLRLAGLTLMVALGLYAALWLAFYIVPLTALVLRSVLELVRDLPSVLRDVFDALASPGWWRDVLDAWRVIPIIVLGTILGLYTGTLLVAMPIAVSVIYVRAWLRALRATAAGALGKPLAVAVPAVVLAAGIGLVVVLNQQPQRQAFDLLAQPPASPVEAEALLDKQDAIRKGLLNAYLAPRRYISAVGEVRHVRDLYKEAFEMQVDEAVRVQNLYEGLARPLLYEAVNPSQPSADWDHQALRREPREAAELYEQFFDQTIVDGEHDMVVRAIRSNWNVEQATADWQAIDDREVRLVQQEVTATEHGDWAEVELHEEYHNVTGMRQEVVYYFSLPETAVVTGLWLGASPDRSLADEYRVSPRGAAQAVYRNEVRRQIDPALIEQIGPRQYRLRIFPIEQQTVLWEPEEGRSSITEGRPLHMWLRYQTLASGNAWPLPQMSEKLNVFWDDRTVRLVNGQPMQLGGAAADTWLPASVDSTNGPVSQSTHLVDFPGGQTVIARPVQRDDLAGLAGNVRLAVVLDRSRSMADQQAAVASSFERLQDLAATGAQVDVYLTSSPYRGEAPSLARLEEFDPGSILYFGGQNPAELLAQFAELRGDRAYDAVLVLTDGSGYELGEGDEAVAIPDAPIWMVHLGGFPLGYDDPTLDAIQASGGGAAAGVDEALARLAARLTGQADGVTSDVVDGYHWLTMPTELAKTLSSVEPSAAQGAEGFAPFAARRLILAEMQQQRGQIADLAVLDRLHALASNYSLVTPLSSMIVLVNQEQQWLLDKLEQEDDRFLREHEDVGETVAVPAVAAVPEPEEWLLIGLAAGLLGYYAWKARRSRRAPRASAG